VIAVNVTRISSDGVSRDFYNAIHGDWGDLGDEFDHACLDGRDQCARLHGVKLFGARLNGPFLLLLLVLTLGWKLAVRPGGAGVPEREVQRWSPVPGGRKRFRSLVPPTAG